MGAAARASGGAGRIAASVAAVLSAADDGVADGRPGERVQRDLKPPGSVSERLALRLLDVAPCARPPDIAADETGLGLETDSANRGAIDAWLNESLVDPRADFRPVLQLASDVGTCRSTASEVARRFIKGIRRDGDFFVKRWRPPSFDDVWYARVSLDPRSFIIADRFVREELPQDRGDFGEEFAVQLERLATGLTPGFVAAARTLVEPGFVSNVIAVAAGAVRALDLYEEVLDGALDALEELRRWYAQEGREQRRTINDGECDEGYEEAFDWQHDDDGYAATVLVEAYVNKDEVARSLEDAGETRPFIGAGALLGGVHLTHERGCR